MDKANILTIDNIEYDQTAIASLSKQSPEIELNLKDIVVLGITISSSDLTHKTENFQINSQYNNSPVIVYHYFGNTVLLAGYKEYLAAIEAGKESIKARLISKPVLKKARFEVYEKPSFLNKTRVNYKRQPRDLDIECLAQEPQERRRVRIKTKEYEYHD